MSHYRVIVYTDADPRLIPLPGGLRWQPEKVFGHKAASCRPATKGLATEIAQMCRDAGLAGIIRHTLDPHEAEQIIAAPRASADSGTRRGWPNKPHRLTASLLRPHKGAPPHTQPQKSGRALSPTPKDLRQPGNRGAPETP